MSIQSSPLQAAFSPPFNLYLILTPKEQQTNGNPPPDPEVSRLVKVSMQNPGESWIQDHGLGLKP